MKLKNKIWGAMLIASLFFISGCDFTPNLYKEILVAQNFLKTQKYDKAIKKYEEILNDNPPNEIKVKIYFQLGELYSIHLSENDTAIKYFKMISEVYTDPLWLVKAEERIGEINFTFKKDYAASVNNYKRLYKFVPKLSNFDFYKYRLGLAYLNLHKLDLAEAIFDNIRKDTNHAYFIKSLYYSGQISFEKKQWARAIAYWNEYIQREKRKDEIVKTKFMMANAYETMEKLKEAYSIYYSLLGEYPNTAVIKSRLNSVYERKVARKR